MLTILYEIKNREEGGKQKQTKPRVNLTHILADGIFKRRELLSIFAILHFSPARKSVFSKKNPSLPQADAVLMLDVFTALREQQSC